MCLSVPMQVLALEAGGDIALVGRGERRERVNMMLLGPQPVGTWVLVSLGFAKEAVAEGELALIEEALAALAASLDGDYRAQDYFSDLAPPAAGEAA
ncbi:HypC/HybG/HupF family hydrogenase formation chaperone [Thauera sp. WB-2]|uniref:HypC/HybG/HupF family hydrogenase formation chaperone n=1 Tax=Thauera sp. WB-2 TaxID=2897772 RepID=UPI0022DD9D10|nr:HypC/HybG/HupF family hydrogenase formation chaperone [Thauera sp. WB-2]WBL64644.1 HypC/HybG/HupF family hydrogenase formation chaperone [Thauera sp. WB-2]